MVSTYLSYSLVNRDMKAALNRVGSDNLVQRQTQYFEDNIGKVNSVEEFLDDYQLYSFAMKAYGLEEMTYAKAFMKKVLESDLSDDKSFANQLTDERYKTFAQAFQFSPAEADAQSKVQETAFLKQYDGALAAQSDALKTESNFYSAAIDNVTSVSGIVNNSRMRDYVLSAFGIDGTYYTKDHLTKVLTSDVSDPNSYVKQLVAKGSKDAVAFYKMAEAFNFNADGSLSAATAQTAAQKDATISLYVEEEQTYVTDFYRQREQAYYEQKMATVTKVSDITSDSRLFNYVKAAFELDSTVTASKFAEIVKSDTSQSGNFAEVNGGAAWVNVADAFNFASDGTVAAGSAQNTAQLALTTNRYSTRYDDADESKKTALTDLYIAKMAKVEKVDDILKDSSLMLLLQRTIGFEAGEFSKDELTKALTSDFTDPASYANRSRDDRLVQLSRMFNFDAEGKSSAPLQAHDTLTATTIAKQYVINEIRFLEGDERTAAKDKATAEAAKYQEKIQSIDSVAALLKDREILDVVIKGFGLDAEAATDDFLKQIFTSDLADPKSFVFEQKDNRWAEMVASFNFDSEGKLARAGGTGIQQRGEVMETVNKYLRQTLEETEGESNQAVRLALYFQRAAPNITDAYGMIADDALMEVFRVTFGYSSDFSSMDVDMQAKVIKDKLNLADLQDPKKLERLLQRFTAMYDIENTSYAGSALTVLTGGGGAGVSADLLISLAQLKA
ncbi:DUF1217 domain-containing protein [Peteryoungia ipomoeae]|uniref:DUF1217 domain-containing protein n=1 Tax=Peteryoungia ipomoeae TaxID=1210932 RepID=A0A4S8NZL3_9HYPH|nr:DUF1217 domain-containing protein [Peteryoungia ipomoeae]THV23197.1 DUF1217 domain-containing protein [Peteryoungia ipomoeae]